MHMKSLKTVILLAELRSFRGVADQLNVTQAAVSSRIHSIEQELGVQLFERDSKGVSLTSKGEQFIEGGRALLLNYEQLARSIACAESLSGRVRIGFNSSMAETLMPLIVQDINQRFENIRFVIHCDINANLNRLLGAGELDFALVVADKGFKAYSQIPLCSFGSRWVASPDFLNKHLVQGPLDGKTLATFPIIAYEAGTPGYERLLARFSQEELDQTEVHISNSLPTSISMASAGIGIASVPPVVIQQELQEGVLRVIETTHHLPPIPFVAAIADRNKGPLSSLIIQLAREAAVKFCQNFSDIVASAEVDELG